MDQLIELLKQIQELAGVGIDALEQATGNAAEGGAPEPPKDDQAGASDPGAQQPPQ